MEHIVAIVGRPNVGKSTLFNRLVDQPQAITKGVPGITRDCNYGLAEWQGKQFTVVDTGGYIPHTQELFAQAIRSQVTVALQGADVILFMVDCKQGVTPLDWELSVVLRRLHKPLLLVANKADHAQREHHAQSFFQLGMGEVYPIAAISGAGTGDLLDAVIQHFPDSPGPAEDQPTLPKIALIGRPNVGKSSLMNALLQYERSIVTPIAGTTRDAVHSYYKLYGKQFIITDTAGIRKKSQVQEGVEFYAVMRAVRALQSADVCLVILDVTQGLTAQDMHLMSLAQRCKKGMVLLANKWDLVSKDAGTAVIYRKKLLQQLKPLDYVPICFISALEKQRIYQAVDKALEVYCNRAQKLASAKLNKVMQQVITQNPPPAFKGKYIKIKYVAQLPVPTPMYAFFCNLPQYIRAPYKAYLEGRLRSHFNFEGVPLGLVFRRK